LAQAKEYVAEYKMTIKNVATAIALYPIDSLNSHPRTTRIPAKRQNNGIRSSANRLTFTELSSRATYRGNDIVRRRMAF
jgi:hypothetical protein